MCIRDSAGGDPLGAKEDGRDAPRFKDLVERYAEVHLPNLAKTKPRSTSATCAHCWKAFV